MLRLIRRVLGLRSPVQPLTVSLEITGASIRSVYASPENLPGLPQVGQTIVVEVPHRSTRYTAVVEQVLFQFRIDAERGGDCQCQDVSVLCRALEQEPLVA